MAVKKQRTIVVLGGAQAGPTAAARARETDESAKIILIERAARVSTGAAGLAYHLSGEVPSIGALDHETSALFRDVYGIDVRTGVEVTGIDPKGKAVLLGDERVGYDALIYALGADSLVPEPLQGAANVHRFRTLDDLAGIVDAIDAGKRRVAVVGGGYFGVEAADGLARHQADVVLVERGRRILADHSPAASAAAHGALTAQGVRIVTGTEVVQAQRTGDDITALVLATGERVAVDLVVAAVGLAPRTELLRKAGAKLLPSGAAVADERMRTTLPGVYVCGVAASVEHRVTGVRQLIAQASVADKTAQIAGANAAGGKLRMAPVLGTAIVRAGDLVVARTGLAHDARKKGVSVTRVHAPSHDPWFPSSSTMSIELRHDAKSGRLLGADLFGRQGVDKRVDVLATAIAGGLTVADLSELDLAYAPPFSAARDPVNVAATVAAVAGAGGARVVEPASLRRRDPKSTLVDVRPSGGRALEGALTIPLSTLRERFDELPEKGELLFVDETGRGGYLAARMAIQRGRAHVGWVSGGLRSVELEQHGA
jgi:NADPH-dependent 2,4-dienoyl-CoA reductase/sulfur reductase-like enzyme/rhodanese-related sulfurtransferase